ncbi:MAG: epoxyqueuosine reductase QueH [Lachnospiraceae bacterium]|nr:epoxyqueuosine reductase QueH [Lachnospiraceae bacterium]
MNRVNYQSVLEQTIRELEKEKKIPRLLLHSCCAPCSSYCLEYLSQYFRITVLYYNPNIFPEEEYAYRISEQIRLVEESHYTHPVQVVGTAYEPEVFYEAVRGLEHIPEGGERCFACYELRLRRTAELAKEQGFDYFTTTLSISPLKNAAKLNEIGGRLSAEYGVPYLYSDFKKKNGYRRSVELSAEHGLYRQDFCGCVYSRQEAEQRKKELAEKNL